MNLRFRYLSRARISLRLRSVTAAAFLLVWCGERASEVAAQSNKDAPAGQVGPREGPKLTKPPALLKFVEAPYPSVEPKPTGDVAVTLTILIDAAGKVAESQVSESGGAAFDEAALAAVRAFEFSPAEIDGKPAAIRIVYRYVFTVREEQVVPTTSVLTGTIRDAESKKLLAHVKVEVAGGPATETDDAGRFRLPELTPGELSITLSGERLNPLKTQETVQAGEELDVTYKVALIPLETKPEEKDDFEILVTAPPPLKKEVVSTKVSAAQAKSIPGAQGDVVRVVENLPGVARSAVGSGQLVVWGAGPEDTRTYVDGVPIPRLYHEGGLRSTIFSGVVGSVELVPGGYGAAFGRGLGGIVRVETNTPGRKKRDKPRVSANEKTTGATGASSARAGSDESYPVSGQVSADVLDGSALVSTGFGRTRIAAAARISVIDQLAKTLDNDVGEYVPIPRYRDGQFRIAHDLASGGHLELVGLLSSDHTARGVPNPDPALTTREARDLSFSRIYARYSAENKRGTRTSITPYVGFGKQSLVNSYGSTRTSLGSDDILVGLRASFAQRLATFLTFEAGLDAEVSHVEVERRGSLGLPAREGDVRVFGQPPPDNLAFDRFKTTSIGVAPYIEADVELFGDRLHIVPGLRVDPMARTVSRRVPTQGDTPDIGLSEQNFVVEPRLSLRYAPHERVTLHAAAGLYHQQPSAADLSSVFGNPALPVSRAVHLVAGAAVKPTDNLSLELTGFTTYLDDLAMRNDQDAPKRAQALLPTGQGHTIGLQTLIRRELANHVFGWVAYTIMRAERQNSDLTKTRLFDYDQTHVLSAVLVWSPFTGFEVGSRFRLASGFPRTYVTGAYYDSQRDRYQPTFGDQNGIRIPLFMQLDLRVSQVFKLGGTDLQVYLEVQNVTNRANTEELVYSPDFVQRGQIRSLPILPIAGVSWAF
jgi:TonB family protein